MTRLIRSFALVLIFILFASLQSARASQARFTLACSPQNDLFVTMRSCGLKAKRFDSPAQAIDAAPSGSAVLLLADDYPAKTLALSESLFRKAAEKQLRLYVEFPSSIPGIELGAPRGATWERFVINQPLGKDLPKGQIMMAHDCSFELVSARDAWVVVGRVAGYNSAVFGIPASAQPILFPLDSGRVLVATTKLSGFITARFAPAREWKALWEHILSDLSDGNEIKLSWTPRVAPMYGPHERLPPNFEKRALQNAAQWCYDSGLLVSQDEWPKLEHLLKSGTEFTEISQTNRHAGDGRFGILEGFDSKIRTDGTQRARAPIRSDCQAESAMVLALDWALNHRKISRSTSTNILDFMFFNSDLCGGQRGNPKHPSFGLVAWGSTAPAWQVANYGDDDARVMMATMLSAASLRTDRYDEKLLRGLFANLRTTGRLGFRGDRVDMPPLEQHGWKYFHDAEGINYSPHFEAYLWACYLWAYAHTGEPEFLSKTTNGIGMMMKAFPNQWRWNDNTERAHMLFCLSWLARIEDTEEHRHWVRMVAEDLIANQQPIGAIPERFRVASATGYQVPHSNEAYGTTETPLIQENGDPVSDQLYLSGFALLGLHEAAAVLHDEHLKTAEDKLAEYLCRIQVRSKSLPQFQGTWFRAFDFERWEPWASSGDAGWGAWSEEAGWAQAWTAAVLGLRQQHTTLWDATASIDLKPQLVKVRAEMAENEGGPWK